VSTKSQEGHTYIIVFLGSLFSREFAGVTGLVFKAIRGRDGFTREFGCDGYENLSGAISWLTFSRAEQVTPGEAEVIGAGNSRNRRFVLSEAEELSLFSPADLRSRQDGAAEAKAYGEADFRTAAARTRLCRPAVKDYVRLARTRSREVFVPLAHPPGHAHVDFGECIGVIGGVRMKLHVFCFDLPHSDACGSSTHPHIKRILTPAQGRQLFPRIGDLCLEK
jgi:hypothetical protein